MTKYIITTLIIVNSLMGLTQVPDTTKLQINEIQDTIVKTIVSPHEDTIISTQEEVEVIEMVEETKEDTTKRKDRRRENKAIVGPDLKEATELNMQRLEASTNDYFRKQDAAPATYIIEGFPFQGVSVFLEGRPKSVHKAWKDYLYKTNKIKLKSKKTKSFLNRKKTPYYKASKATLTNVSHRVGDVLTVFQKENGLVKMTVIYKLGYNVSVNPENFPEAYGRLVKYVEQFSQVNFTKYYGENLKNLDHTIKVVDKETKKESKHLRKLEKKYKRFLRKNETETDQFQELAIEVQKKLLKVLAAEKSQYQYRIMQYKSRNSDLRLKSVE